MNEKQKKRLNRVIDSIGHVHSYRAKVVDGKLQSVCKCGHSKDIPVLGEMGGNDAQITWYKDRMREQHEK